MSKRRFATKLYDSNGKVLLNGDVIRAQRQGFNSRLHIVYEDRRVVYFGIPGNRGEPAGNFMGASIERIGHIGDADMDASIIKELFLRCKDFIIYKDKDAVTW